MIINGELQTGLGGGVCQVSTTVFNAAFVAGLPITARTNHALYISHYPLGRDATVDYPNIDLKFVNDTGHWLLLRTFVGSSSLVVNLYGTPQNRRVETETAPLRVVAPPPIEKLQDDSIEPGTRVVSLTAGGGGFGSPIERDPARVRRDVIEGWITQGRAAEVYGVVLDESRRVDPKGTETRRAEIAGKNAGEAAELR